MTDMQFDDAFFDSILKSGVVLGLQKEAAERVLARAKANAPVDSGDYKKGLRIRKVERKHRSAYLVEGTDWKTLLVEAKTGNLARALKQVGKG